MFISFYQIQTINAITLLYNYTFYIPINDNFNINLLSNFFMISNVTKTLIYFLLLYIF